MLVAIAIITGLVLVCNIAGLWAMARVSREMNLTIKQFTEEAQDIRSNVEAFITSPGKNEKNEDLPSPLATAIFGVAQMVGSQIASSAAAILNANRSHISKALTTLNEDVAGEAIAGNNPVLGAITELPGLKKSLAKKPWLAGALSKLDLSGLLNGPGAGSAKQPPNNGNNHRDPFRV